MPAWIVLLAAGAYLGMLFAVAHRAERAADAGRSLIASPFVYTLSLGVYATAWTFYGSVGRAAATGIGFLPVYLGPTVMAALWWTVLRKIVRIAKDNRITSLADFVSSRYGKSGTLAGLVTGIAVVGVTPYISLQLKAISTGFDILRGYPEIRTVPTAPETVWQDTAFYAALVLAAFTIVFGTRKLDAAERHEGMVAAIALESLVKLVAFLAVGAYVTWGMYDGVADVFSRAAAVPSIVQAFTIGGGTTDIYRSWASMFSVAFVSMLAILLLPRQFQVAVVENVDETHIEKAIWLFPLYLFLFNVFVPPIAFGGLVRFAAGGVDPDTFVLTLPMAGGQEALALFVFLGGFSAATGMVIVETIALSTMVCNDLAMPVLLRVRALRLAERADLSGLLLAIRRFTIVMGVLFGYAFYRVAGESYALVSIGLVSFAAVAQLGPALLGGLFWKGATRSGALAGLTAGFVVWAYTLLSPAFVRSGWLPTALLEEGPLGIALLRPHALFGLEGLDELTHALLWSMVANVGAYVAVSVTTEQSELERTQAALFVDAFRHERGVEHAWRARGSLPDLFALASRFLGPEEARRVFSAFARLRGQDWPREVDAELVRHCEAHLAGVVGAATARVAVGAVVEEEPLRDPLTGLPNRALLVTRIDDALHRTRLEPRRGFALAYVVLDRFAWITDSLGAVVGDQLLIAVARHLGAQVGPGDTLARVDGHSFALLFDAARDADEAVRIVERLQGELAAGMDVEGRDLYVTASVGIALGRPGCVDPEEPLRDAQIAAHTAARRGGACHEVFAADMRRRVVALLEMETQLRRAVLGGEELVLHYQPVVALGSGRLAGFEALVRMRRPDGTLVPPGEFIPLTEETGLVLSIGRWALAEACRQMCAWKARYPDHPHLRIGVNLSGRQIARPDFPRQVEEVLKETGLDTASLELEVTETVLMEHAEAATSVLQRLRALGIKLLMDDFGTGYSSLSYLHRFPVDTLKIDASFVRRMDADRESADIVRTIAALAHTLHKDIVAEGVESAAQLARLRELRVEYGQGYHFAPPLDAAAAEAMIAARPTW